VSCWSCVFLARDAFQSWH